MTDSIVFVNGKSKCGCEMKFSSGHGEYSDVHRITPCRIHAATSAQTPFIFGISDPDGGAYIEEMCVSSSASNLTEEVACLNADVVAGDPLYEVVPLYRKVAPSIPYVRETVRKEHAEWSQATFGNVGPVGPLKHLAKEALEAAAEPGDLSEWADMQFLLWDAQRRAGITDEQINQAMFEKLAVNKTREWPEPKDGEPRLHIKGGAE